MPGNRYLLDTNALVALLQGNQELVELTQNAHWLGVSSAALNQATVLTNDTQLLSLGKVDFGYSARGFSIAE